MNGKGVEMKKVSMVIVLLLGLFGVTAASAESAHATVNIYTYDPDGSINNVYSCTADRVHSYPNTPIISISNIGCGYRLWIHQNANSSGWSFCISPGAYNTIPSRYQYPGNLQVSANRAACP
jgi:hypothetical protein